MCMLKLSHLMAIVPISALLTVSFFVLFTLRKVEEKGLKLFGYVVVSFLWLAALVVFSGAVYKTAQRSFGRPDMMQRGMMSKDMMQNKAKMDCMQQKMQKKEPSDMMMPESLPLAKTDKGSGMSKCQANKGIFRNE